MWNLVNHQAKQLTLSRQVKSTERHLARNGEWVSRLLFTKAQESDVSTLVIGAVKKLGGGNRHYSPSTIEPVELNVWGIEMERLAMDSTEIRRSLKSMRIYSETDHLI